MSRSFLTVTLAGCLALIAYGFVANPGSIPAEIVGKWKWGTINPTWFEDSNTGKYKGHGGGVSAFFDFDRSGRFQHHLYVETHMNGCKTQTFTTMEGILIVKGDEFRLSVEKGRFKSQSNAVKRHNFDREMTGEERIAQSQKTYRWNAAYGEGGSISLDIANAGQSSPISFVPAK